MARHPERTKSRSSIFPVKFKGFVKDVRSFTRDFKLERKSEDLGSTEKPADVIVEIPSSPTECSAPLYTANLNVQVSLQFDEPLDFSYTRHYEGSPSLVVTEKLCQGLLHRVDHCSQELITRKDANALQRTRNNGLGKAVRFELHIQINRGSDVWAVRTFTSYQKQPMTAEAAREIALETHYIIGLFLLQHDDGFVLKDGAIRDDPSQSPETHPFRAGRVQPISCVPRSYFLQGSQRFESIPGYTIHLKMINRNHRRKPSEWQNTVEVNSQQTTPLNLAIAESLFFEAAQAMETILRFERDSFEDRHRSCASPDGCSYWRQHEGDGFELELSIKNNLGPQFEHLQRTVSSSIALLSHLQTGDCDKFANVLEQAFTGVRDSADEKMNSMHDLEFRIIELRGRGWALEEPLLFTIDPSSTQSRRDTEAVLDRVQAGIADILRRNAMAVRMTAYKRGHLILDKTLVAREPLDQPEGRRRLHKTSKEHVLDRLKARIEKDIGLICKDTCSLSSSEDDDVQIPDGTGPRCLPAYEDESATTEVRTTVSPSRASVESTVDPNSIRTLTPAHPARSDRTEELYPPPPSTPPPPPPPIPQLPSAHRKEIGASVSPLESPVRESQGADKNSSKEDMEDEYPREGSSKFSISPTLGGYLSKGRTAFPRLETGTNATSTAPTTPSLISGEVPTPRSSHEVPHHGQERVLGIETGSCGGSIANSDPYDDRGDDKSKGFRSNFFSGKTALPSLKRWVTKPNKTPSPLHQGYSASDGTTAAQPEGTRASEKPSQETNPENRSDITEKTSPTPEASVVSELYTVIGENSAIKQPSEAPEPEPKPGMTEPVDSLSEYEAALRSLETGIFSQSRLDFDFSSPASTSPNSPIDDLSESESLPSPTRRLSSQSHRNSFGSAGFLGFHEEKIVQVSLRRALMGSPSRKSKGSNGGSEKDTQRPRTAK